MFKALFLTLLAMFLLFGTGMRCEENPSKVPEGSTLEGENIEGLSYEKFEEIKEEIVQEWNNREIKLVLLEAEKESVVGVQELGLSFYFDNEEELMKEPADFKLKLDYCEETIEKKIEDLFPLVLTEPEDAELIVEQEPKIKEHQSGKRIALEEAIELIVENARGEEVILPVEDFLPAVTGEDIREKGVNELISSYSTEFKPWEEKRAANIELAVNSIDHNLISPDKNFSFNENAGPFNSANGFKEAPVFREGEITTGIGGGVCQVSSTLYNAVLLSGMETIERYSHSLPVWYVPLGRDAAVSYGGADLKFKNSLDNHVYIRMEVDMEKGLIQAKIYGTKQFEVEVGSQIEDRIEPPLEEEEDEDIEEKEVVEEGQYGFEAISWRLVDGEYEFLSRDYYSPLERVVKVPIEEEDPEEKEDEKEPDVETEEEHEEDSGEEKPEEEETEEREEDEDVEDSENDEKENEEEE